MTHFEYISVALSLVFALVLSRLLGAIPSVFRADRRYWIHTLWVFNMLGLVALSWWATWSARHARLSPVYFVLLLAIPGIMYVRSTVLVTADSSNVISWRSHFYESRMWFFGIGVLGSVNAVAAPLVGGAPWSADVVVVPGIFAVGLAIGMASDREWVHGLLSILGAVGILGALLLANMAAV